MSNPTTGADKADSSGRFPQVFAASTATFDILLKDAAGVTLASYVSVSALGAQSGVLSLDFTNSRFQARGSGGTVFVEAGDPTGDDVGGHLTFGGWNGTQADAIAINAAATSMTGTLDTGGALTENAHRLAGIVYTPNGTFSTVASVDIPLTNSPTGTRVYDLDIIDLAFSAALNLEVRFSYDGGVTYKAGASDYAYNVMWSDAGGASSANSAAAAFMVIASGAFSPANSSSVLFMRITTPTSGSDTTVIAGKIATWLTGTPSARVQVFGAHTAASFGRATHIRLLTSTGTMTGRYRVVPQRGFGET